MVSSDSSCYYYFDEEMKKSRLVTTFPIHINRSTYMCSTTSSQSSGTAFLAGMSLLLTLELVRNAKSQAPLCQNLIKSGAGPFLFF